jgi:hypothetical protein
MNPLTLFPVHPFLEGKTDKRVPDNDHAWRQQKSRKIQGRDRESRQKVMQ